MAYAGSPWFPPGTILFSNGKSTYEMVEDLGPGHHGERVLVARHRVKGDARGKVILKALPLPAVTSELRLARQRLEEEVRLAGYLSHPNIGSVFGMHKAQGALYVMTESVTGCSLNTLVDWASPEALLGQPEDARSDLFTLGMVLVEFATGRHLLSAPDMLLEDLWALVPQAERERLGSAIARMQDEWGGVDPEETLLRAATFTPADVDAATQRLSEPTRAVFRKLLRRDPAERYPSALALQEALSNVLRERGGYSAEHAAAEIQAALRRAGEARADEEDGAQSAFCVDSITTEPSPP